MCLCALLTYNKEERKKEGNKEKTEENKKRKERKGLKILQSK